MIKYITSRKNQIIVDTIQLRNNKTSTKKKQFIIEGDHLFEMAIKSGNVKYLFSLKHINGINENIDQYIVTQDILEKISINKSTPNVIAICEYVNEQIDEKANKLVYLDNIQDPGNLGTILRSSLAFSYKNVLISSDSVNKYNEKAIQSSQGALFNLNIETCNVTKLQKLKDSGYKIIVTLLDKDAIKLNDFSIPKTEKYVIVLGNEGQGVRKEIIDLADYKVFIEIDNIDSLNVAIAGAIIMHKLNSI